MPAVARPTATVVIDNGGHTCKVGFAGQAEPVKSMPNGIAKSKTEHKVFVADQVDACKDFSALQYRNSLERGCLVNWDVQSQVWTRAFGPEVLKVSPADCSLLLSEIPMCPTAIQDTLDEMIFEHFGFQSYCTRPAPVLAALAIKEQQAETPPRPATLVLDAGYSALHCVPIFGGSQLNFGVKRLNVGGKLLTNHLKQVVSYRAYNVMDETHLINDVKERLCYVSLDFETELAVTRFKGKKNTLRRDFVLPDYVHHFRGRIRDPNAPAEDAAAPGAAPAPPAAAREASGAPSKKKQQTVGPTEQVLSLSNERICVPELLFSPSDIGIDQAGVAECVAQAANACSPDLRESLFGNIVLTGGSSLFPNFAERLQRELRALVPSDFEIGVSAASEPINSVWRGGSIFAAADGFQAQTVTRAEYHEHGHALCRRRFLA